MSEHTPTPWRIKEALGSYSIRAMRGPIEVQPCTAHSLDDADLIVRAVNAHDYLVKALEDARKAIASLPDDALGINHMGNDEVPGGIVSWPIRDELLHHIDAALRLASGEEQ